MPLFLMFSRYYGEMFKSYPAKIAGLSVILLTILGVTLYMNGQTQDPRQRASEPNNSTVACPTPPTCDPDLIVEVEKEDENNCPVFVCR